MHLTEAELDAELSYFTECLATDEEGTPCLYNEATEEYEYIEDANILNLAEALLDEGKVSKGISKRLRKLFTVPKNKKPAFAGQVGIG